MATEPQMKFNIKSNPQPFDALGLMVFLRTYARRIKDDDPMSPVESWDQCLTRCVNALNSQLKCNLTKDEAQEFFDLLHSRKCSLAGRFMWQLGTKTVDKLGLMSLQNCAFCVIDSPVQPFIWIMNFLMLGAGCGYRILPEDVAKFPRVKPAAIIRRDDKDSDFIVPDSRQGWVKLLGKTLKAHFYSGKSFTYSTHCLRSRGAPIKSFGGLSSGPEVLCDGIAKISEILNNRASTSNPCLTTVDALDICNIIGMIVVSGNVRRCIPKGSLVHTDKGFVPIQNIIPGTMVLTTDGYHKVLNVFNQGLQSIVKIITSQGSFVCTPNHRMATKNFATSEVVWKMAVDLNSADYLLSIIEGTKYSLNELNMERVLDVVLHGVSETWDIEVETKHEFFCEGYLTHNSAQIALGDVKDKEFLRAKRWDLGMIPNWRCYSNNSVICNDINDVLEDEEFWNGYQGNGEPYGLINLKLAQSCGRIGETQYSDSGVEGVNPCSEQSLERWETCCLGEIYLPNVTSYEELKKCASYIYRACKHSLTLPCIDSKETEDIVHKNMRMGIGYTGILQSTDEQRSWIKPCYEYLRQYDKEYSEKHNFPTSIKLSTVKPSGTLSLLGGCTAGIHPGYSRYYIRRIRVSSESKLIQLAKNYGYPVEYVQNFDGSLDYSTQVISFPYSLPEHTILAENMSAIQQLEWVKWAQTNLSDNAVSVTVYYRKEELNEIKAWLKENYNDNIKAVSFLLHSDHGFKQAPLEKISKEQYEEMMMFCKPIDDVGDICHTDADDKFVSEGECAGGVCPMK